MTDLFLEVIPDEIAAIVDEFEIAPIPEDVVEQAWRYYRREHGKKKAYLDVHGLVSFVRHDFTNYLEIVARINGEAMLFQYTVNGLIRKRLSEMGFNMDESRGGELRRE